MRLRSGADMKRKLTWYDLIALGVGGMLGVGVFVTTGPVARDKSGPGVLVSYVIAGISALFSSLCYTEFSIQIPVAGGAFSYLRVTFGMNLDEYIYNKLFIYFLANVSYNYLRKYSLLFLFLLHQGKDNCGILLQENLWVILQERIY